MRTGLLRSMAKSTMARISCRAEAMESAGVWTRLGGSNARSFQRHRVPVEAALFSNPASGASPRLHDQILAQLVITQRRALSQALELAVVGLQDIHHLRIEAFSRPGRPHNPWLRPEEARGGIAGRSPARPDNPRRTECARRSECPRPSDHPDIRCRPIFHDENARSAPLHKETPPAPGSRRPTTV